MSFPPPENKPVVLTKETISRLLRDVKNIMKNPLTENGIYYIHDDEDMLKGYALIVGPSETPYFGGNYLFEINYPSNYPHSPPSVKYCTNGENIRFNPNLYTSGKVCISILNTWRGEQWTSCQTITTLLLNLCTLLCKDPLLNEPGILKTHNDFDSYTKIIHYKNIDIAILKMLNKNSEVYPVKFDIFHSIMRENFVKNSSVILADLEKLALEQPNSIKIYTSLYNMNVIINYSKLLSSFKETMERFN